MHHHHHHHHHTIKDHPHAHHDHKIHNNNNGIINVASRGKNPGQRSDIQVKTFTKEHAHTVLPHAAKDNPLQFETFSDMLNDDHNHNHFITKNKINGTASGVNSHNQNPDLRRTELLMMNQASRDTDIMKNIFIICSIPILYICMVSLFQIVLKHAPYFTGKCKSFDCVAGSLGQFAMWSVLCLFALYFLSLCLFKVRLRRAS